MWGFRRPWVLFNMEVTLGIVNRVKSILNKQCVTVTQQHSDSPSVTYMESLAAGFDIMVFVELMG